MVVSQNKGGGSGSKRLGLRVGVGSYGCFPKIGGPQYRSPNKYCSPYYWDPHKSTPNFGKPPCAVRSRGQRASCSTTVIQPPS